MNISEKMKELIASLADGFFNNVDIEPLQPECEEEWCEDYAIGHGLYFSPVWNEEYFDEDKFQDDILNHIKNHFGPNAVILDYKDKEKHDALTDDQIVIHFIRHCGEIEVYRMKHARRNKDVQPA